MVVSMLYDRYGLAKQSSSAKYPLGAEYHDTDADNRARKHVYLQADGTIVIRSACVLIDGEKAKKPTTATLGLPVVVAKCAVTTAYYAWFQFEGRVSALIDGSGTATAVDDELMLANASHKFVKSTTRNARGAGVCKTAVTADTYGNVYLRGMLGAVEGGVQAAGSDGVANYVTAKGGVPLLFKAVCVATDAGDKTFFTAPCKLLVVDAWLISRSTDAANVKLKNATNDMTAATAKSETVDTVTGFSTIVAARDEIAAAAAVVAHFSAAGSADVFLLAVPID